MVSTIKIVYNKNEILIKIDIKLYFVIIIVAKKNKVFFNYFYYYWYTF